MNLIGNFGFPIALVFYFLLRFEKKIDELSNTLSSLLNQISIMLIKEKN
ncbi:YvrJ family protein [Aerococcaceae bacterium NML180378]|nr:YvrJ family protein [Aerococcaceae bacterium NML180378]